MNLCIAKFLISRFVRHSLHFPMYLTFAYRILLQISDCHFTTLASIITMPRLKLEYSYSSSLIGRLLNLFNLNRGTYRVPIFTDEELFVSDAPLPDEGHVSAPLEFRNQGVRLLLLPRELLVLIILFLPHSSLYMVRQTCSAIRNLTDDFKFQAFRTDILRSGEEHSCITKAGFGELRNIQQILLRRSLCTPCGRL